MFSINDIWKSLPFVKKSNPTASDFIDVDDNEQELIDQNSAVERAIQEMNKNEQDQFGTGSGKNSNNNYYDLVYGSVPSNKLGRLRQYRIMASFPEVNDAIDEICDQCINYDDMNKFANLVVNCKKLTSEQVKIIEEQFDKFISLYDFEKFGFEYFRYFMINGEITWENIIDKKNTSKGFIGTKRIPAETYEYLIEEGTGEFKAITFNAEYLKTAEVPLDPNSGGGTMMNSRYVTQTAPNSKDNKKTIIPFPMNQITNVNSGWFSNDKRIIFPYIENARRAYRQLMLIEDAILIYRLVRAPERLVFYVATGNVSARKQEERVLQVMKRFSSKKVYDPTTGGVVNGYDPKQLMENYFFAKPEDGSTTDVKSLSSGNNLGELADLKYFQRKLYLALKVPYSRFHDDLAMNSKMEEMTPEDERFFKYIERIQKRFAIGLYDAFKVHLKLTGLWENYKLYDRALFIRFVPPTAYELYRTQQLLKIKLENYDNFVSHEEFSVEYAQKHHLGMTAEEIEENYVLMQKELIRKAQIERKVANVMAFGTEDELPVNGLGEDELVDGQDTETIPTNEPDVKEQLSVRNKLLAIQLEKKHSRISVDKKGK